MPPRLLHSPTISGSLVLSARLKAGLTQQQLAARLGVTQPVVAAYESGRRQPTVPTLMKMLAATGFDLRLSLAPHEDHDETLDALERRRPSEEQERWRDYQRDIVDAARRHLQAE
ncbi:MAG TPA: helix-turn-helix transcriptional regulator [Acidimicrobiales bacterium]|nr:helix-turn-helix transcriptional regulator [Acidimicrobiales bacterium]